MAKVKPSNLLEEMSRKRVTRGTVGLIEEMSQDKLNDDYYLWRKMEDENARRSLQQRIRFVARDNREPNLIKRINALKPIDKENVMHLIKQFERYGELGYTDVIKIVAEKRDVKRDYLSGLLEKISYYQNSERRLPRIYLTDKSTKSAIGRELSKTLKEYLDKDTKKWDTKQRGKNEVIVKDLVGQFYNERVHDNEVIWHYKTDAAFKDYQQFNQKLRNKLLYGKYKVTKKEAKDLRDWWKNRIGSCIVDFDSNEIDMDDLVNALKIKDKVERKKRVIRIINPKLDFFIQMTLKNAIGGGVVNRDKVNKKLRGQPNISMKKSMSGYNNSFRKYFKAEYNRLKGKVSQGMLTENQARFMANEFARNSMKGHDLGITHGYANAAGTNHVHTVINVSGSNLDKLRKLLPNDRITVKRVNKIVQQAVEATGSVYYASGMDTTSKDHLHISLDLNPNVDLVSVMTNVKIKTAQYLNNKRRIKGFSWSGGFGFKGAAAGLKARIMAYILRQQDANIQNNDTDELKDIVNDDFDRGKNFMEKRKTSYLENRGRCTRCGKPMFGEYQGHHKTPVSRGGKDKDIAAECCECHKRPHGDRKKKK